MRHATFCRLFLALAVAVSGCESAPPRVTRTTSSTYPALPPGARVQVFTGDQRPATAWDEIGLVRPAGSVIEMRFEEALEKAKVAARAQGGDVVIYRGAAANAKSGAFDGRPLTIYEFVIGRTRPAPITAPAAPSSTATVAAFCAGCGVAFSADARFCAGCGRAR